MYPIRPGVLLSWTIWYFKKRLIALNDSITLDSIGLTEEPVDRICEKPDRVSHRTKQEWYFSSTIKK